MPRCLDDVLKVNTKDFASVVLDKETHKSFTQEWNSVLESIRNVYNNHGDVKAEILKQAEKIYKDFPEMLEVTKKWLEAIQ